MHCDEPGVGVEISAVAPLPVPVYKDPEIIPSYRRRSSISSLSSSSIIQDFASKISFDILDEVFLNIDTDLGHGHSNQGQGQRQPSETATVTGPLFATDSSDEDGLINRSRRKIPCRKEDSYPTFPSPASCDSSVNDSEEPPMLPACSRDGDGNRNGREDVAVPFRRKTSKPKHGTTASRNRHSLEEASVPLQLPYSKSTNGDLFSRIIDPFEVVENYSLPIDHISGNNQGTRMRNLPHSSTSSRLEAAVTPTPTDELFESLRPSSTFPEVTHCPLSDDNDTFPDPEPPFCKPEKRTFGHSIFNLFKKKLRPRIDNIASGSNDIINRQSCNGNVTTPSTSRALPPPPSPRPQEEIPVAEEEEGDHHFHHHHLEASWSEEEAAESPVEVADFSVSIEKVKDCGWYWGSLSSEMAEDLLRGEPDGSFIVRDSNDAHYIFSLTFKLNGLVRHVRIEHDQGNFSFGPLTRFKAATIVDFVEKAVAHSRSGRYLFFLHRRPVLGPMRVQLLHPCSRFRHPRSLQHMCRFVILKHVRRDLIERLPLPKPLQEYLNTPHYYFEKIIC